MGMGRMGKGGEGLQERYMKCIRNSRENAGVYGEGRR